MQGPAGIAIVGRGVEKGERVAAEITGATGVPVLMIGADLGRMEDVRSIVPKVDERFGRVDILVNAAGLTDRGNIFNTEPELFDRMIAVNTRAPFFLIQDAGRVMDREGIEGRIVNVGSMSAHAGQPFLAPYSISKGALDHFDAARGVRAHAKPYPRQSARYRLDEFGPRTGLGALRDGRSRLHRPSGGGKALRPYPGSRGSGAGRVVDGVGR
jgi:NAD(P)-dependent dehydrogenase (short-subunit alcohol dehydrogenase family)